MASVLEHEEPRLGVQTTSHYVDLGKPHPPCLCLSFCEMGWSPGPALGAAAVWAGVELTSSWPPPQELPGKGNYSPPHGPALGQAFLHLDLPTQTSQLPIMR